MADFLKTTNISLYTLPLAWLLCITPRMYSMRLFTSSTGRSMDTTLPRGLADRARTEGAALTAATRARILRAEAAQANGCENVGYFAAAVVAGNFAGVGKGWLNGLSLGYLFSRVVYNWAYIKSEGPRMALARTVVFFVGQGMIWTFFVMAGNRLR
ncbi:hypothetical protein B0A48_03772 [Cryoendolithus antarcticus]|uniref:Uncharacterized protein n=1 Tax=Cryoendolithus antarcticus TaxID=1507870 RepID=A0A1V8TGH5_9PEZI|nr:hypothetical protein B0A48_03772 [Cryoendolithus antarcticus]